MPLSAVDVKKALLGMRYPATTTALLDHVVHNGAAAEVVGAISQLPPRVYKNATDVAAAILH